MELNEWNFAIAIQKQLNDNGIAKFKILPETTSTIWNLVAQDDDGNIYRVQNDEATKLFLHLFMERNLVSETNLSRNEIIFFHNK